MWSRFTFPLLSLLILVSSAEYSPLYVLASVNAIGNQTEYPVELLEIDLNTNSSTSLLQWTSKRALKVIGSAYDAANMIYYYIQDNKLSAIDVANNQFLYQDYDFAQGELVFWDIAIDSEGNIHYLSKSGTVVEGRTMVNYCKFNTQTKNSTVLLASITAMNGIGSVAYAENSKTLLTANTGSKSPPDPVISISQDGYVTAVPMNRAIYAQSGIEWNPLTNVSVFTQTNINNDPQHFFQIAQYVPFVNEYPVICTISTESTIWRIYPSASDGTSLDPISNAYAVLVNKASGDEQEEKVSVITAVNLNTCDQTWYKHPYGTEEFFMAGPEFGYSQSALDKLKLQVE